MILVPFAASDSRGLGAVVWQKGPPTLVPFEYTFTWLLRQLGIAPASLNDSSNEMSIKSLLLGHCGLHSQIIL